MQMDLDYTPQLTTQLQGHLGIHIQILCLWRALGHQVTISENDHGTTQHKVCKPTSEGKAPKPDRQSGSNSTTRIARE